MTADQVRNIIRKRVAQSSQAQFAREAGCSRAYICEILQGGRNPGPKVLRALGLIAHRSRTVRYVAE